MCLIWKLLDKVKVTQALNNIFHSLHEDPIFSNAFHYVILLKISYRKKYIDSYINKYIYYTREGKADK